MLIGLCTKSSYNLKPTFFQNEITTDDAMVICEASDTTDHPLAITAGCNSTETNTPDLPLAFTCHSTKTKSGNHSISSNGCRQFPNKTPGNQTGDCQPADLNCNHIKSTLRNHDNANLVTTVCGFADQGYVDFYRVWVIIDSFFYFLLPVLVLVTANTATWIKVYRSTRKSPTSEKALAIRRTRHVLILTSLISAGFITFAGPATVIFIIKAILADDPQYVLYNGETLAVLQFIGECLFLCNHTFNFFLYILSGKGFRNSLRAAFCKYEG